MAIEPSPEQQPGFNFEMYEAPHYSHEKVAEEVMWPLVDDYTKRNWREEAILGQSLLVSGFRMHEEGKTFDVTLVAKCELDDEPEAEEGPKTLPSLELHIEEIQEGERRQNIIDAATTECEDEEEHDIFFFKDSALVVKSVVQYIFNNEKNEDGDNETDFEIHINQLIESDAGDYIWSSLEEEMGDSDEDDEDTPPRQETFKLRAHDMGMIAIGLSSLRASNDMVVALERIKAAPQFGDEEMAA